ncbi:hypothetical protein DID96_12390 [Burkholderia sp. Bp8963]|uniref:hypothetical protein n=1 Tax=Burkholderia sp. Bp8963 TaxID=2184547 RepID=UPI000F5B3A19|nr:hypothetical protein [Burkholderia sp. Bp8963]RQS71531.1 hypothetical protein DID96_12390 [Burkholderia sp. Bp8963]
MPDIDDSMQKAGALADALQDLLRQMIEKIIGGPSKGKNGEPLRDVCVMVRPLGDPIDPRDFSYAWDPAGGDSAADMQDDGKLGTSALAAAPAPAPGAPAAAPVVDEKLQHALASARNIATKFDQMMRVTDDGSYRPFTSAGTLSSSYEAIITKAQGIPAPPLPANIQKQIDDAMHVLYVFDDAGQQKGHTRDYKTYQQLRLAYTQAEADFANAQAAAMSNAALGQAWPVASKALKAAVDNAYDDWRSANAEKIENALETVKGIGGSIGNHFLAQARSLFDAWSLSLAGGVAVGVPYTQVMPSTWYDPNDKENGFTTITASNSQFLAYGQSRCAQQASSWYQGHSSSTSGGGGGMIFGVTFGASGGHSDSDQHQGSQGSSSQSSSFSHSMSNVSIQIEFGLCDIYRPWLLRELFVIDGWYLPGEKDQVVSDGTIGGQKGDDDKHLLPMIPTQFLVVRNVKITADGWGDTGNQMSQFCRDASSEGESSSSHVSGGVGFLCLGGTVSHDNADWSGSDSESSSAAGSWYYSGDANHGTLAINGCQIVGWVGEIVPVAPKIDGTKQSAPAPTPGPAPAPAPAG